MQWWAEKDSNLRTPRRGDLQSPAIAAMRSTHYIMSTNNRDI